jgi:hypothetical protein
MSLRSAATMAQPLVVKKADHCGEKGKHAQPYLLSISTACRLTFGSLCVRHDSVSLLKRNLVDYLLFFAPWVNDGWQEINPQYLIYLLLLVFLSSLCTYNKIRYIRVRNQR